MHWDNAEVPMQEPTKLNEGNIDKFEKERFLTSEPETTDAARIQQILDIKYSKADLETLVNKIGEINPEQKTRILEVLKKFEHLFDGSLGEWKTAPVELELKDPSGKPYHAKPYPVPQSQEAKLKAEIERLVELKVLRKVNESEWASPAFTISKPDGTLRSLTDSRELNKRLKLYPYPLPKIQDMLQKLEGFQWATS